MSLFKLSHNGIHPHLSQNPPDSGFYHYLYHFIKANSSVNSIVFMEEWVVVNDLNIKLKEKISRM